MEIMHYLRVSLYTKMVDNFGIYHPERYESYTLKNSSIIVKCNYEISEANCEILVNEYAKFYFF